MTALPSSATKVHLDQDSDDIYAARAELSAHTDKINTIISYLSGLFGSDGVKITALTTLGAGFPAGTQMIFYQPTVPLGWTLIPPAVGHYLVLGHEGAQVFGSFDHVTNTTSVILAQGHLPAVSITGVTNWTGDHAHGSMHTATQVANPGVASIEFMRPGQAGPTGFVWITGQTSSGAGQHYHDVSIPLGGQNWPHNHSVNFSEYRPRGIQVIAGRKS